MSFHSCRQARARLVALCTSLLLIVVGTGPASAAICHVSTAGNSGGIGSTWASPMDLQTALTTPGCSEVWVKAGAYTPGTTNADSFDIPPGVEVYGGFAGTESSRGERDASINLSILSGDIDNNDANAGSTHIDKTSALTSSAATASTLLPSMAPPAPRSPPTQVAGQLDHHGRRCEWFRFHSIQWRWLLLRWRGRWQRSQSDAEQPHLQRQPSEWSRRRDLRRWQLRWQQQPVPE